MTHAIRLAVVLSTLAGCSHAEIADGSAPIDERAGDPGAEVSALQAIYLLKQLGPDQYAVDLTGGQSELVSGRTQFGLPEPEPRPVVRTLTGRVLDGQGRPVAGAVVLGGERLSMFLSTSLSGSHGVTTDGEGFFSLPVTSGEALTLVAMANETAWSPLMTLPAGEADVERDLVLGAPAEVTGTVARGGEHTAATVYVTSPDRAYMIRFFTEDDGSFESPPLPPGRFEVAFTPGADMAPSNGRRTTREVRLAAGAEESFAMELPVGTALTGIFEGLSDEPRLQTVTFTLVHGAVEPADPAALSALLEGPDAPESRMMLQGGTDLRDDQVFGDLLAGQYTMCIEARGSDDPRARFDALSTLAFQCRTVDVDGAAPSQELRFSLDARDGRSTKKI